MKRLVCGLSLTFAAFAVAVPVAVAVAGAFALGGCGDSGPPPRPTDPGADDGSDRSDDPNDPGAAVPVTPSRPVCAPSTTPGIASCHARVVTAADGVVPYTATPKGLAPVDLQSAYEIDPQRDPGATIAIVDSNDDPNAEADLATYRKHFGLPACTKANGCFRKVNQRGKTSPLPAADAGWASEIALDLDMASATCPKCKLLLVEADSADMKDLGAAVDEAVSLGASVVSNSYGGPEAGVTAADEAHYRHDGVQIFVSAGDSGYGVEYPAASPHVTAVGGTSLKKSSTVRGWTERVWGTAGAADGGTGSGCSAKEAKPAWQKDTQCTHRTVADVAAVADPATGVAVYDSYGGRGWADFGGTSAAAPIVAGIMAGSGHATADASLIYTNHTAFHDVASGTNGSCDATYLCKAARGYDGPTGIGTPNSAALAGLASGDAVVVPYSNCAHDTCVAGDALTNGCSACATTICAADPACCASVWDGQCAREAADVCGRCIDSVDE